MKRGLALLSTPTSVRKTMARIYVGNLPMDVRERELDDIFYKFGRITDIAIRRPNRPPAFGELLLPCRSWTPKVL